MLGKLLHCCLIHLSGSTDVLGILFKCQKVDPGVVVFGVFGQFVFVEVSPFSQDHLVDLFL
jgi:hypothetical protein